MSGRLSARWGLPPKKRQQVSGGGSSSASVVVGTVPVSTSPVSAVSTETPASSVSSSPCGGSL